MVKVNWTNEAETWLKDIYQKTQILQFFPQIGYSHLNAENIEIRVLLYGHYRIAYLIKNENKIDILGIFHGSLDIKRYL